VISISRWLETGAASNAYEEAEMKLMTMLGLAIIAALALAMSAGAGSASAWGFCKKKEAAPCESHYKAEQIYNGSLEEGTTAKFTGGTEATCEIAGIEFKQLSEFGSPVAEVRAATFGGCTKTVEAVDLPWEVRFADISGGKGLWEAKFTAFGAGAPGVKVGTCTYTAIEPQLELRDTLFTGGAPKLSGNLSLTGTCGSENVNLAYRLAQTIYPG
jgi:hypothetical protein